MNEELNQAGISVAGLANRLEEAADVDVLAEYRCRRQLSEADEWPYLAGRDAGVIFVRDYASAAALKQAWRIRERGGSWRTLPDLAAQLEGFLEREAEESRSGSRWARIDPQLWSWEDDSIYIGGILDAAAAAWVALRDESPRRAAELADPYAPANRRAFLDLIEEEQERRRSEDPELFAALEEARAAVRAEGERLSHREEIWQVAELARSTVAAARSRA